MINQRRSQVFLSYTAENQDFVEALARRLEGDARFSFWFAPWHSVPGVPVQEQMEEALLQAESCAVFIGNGADRIVGWQNEQLRAAIQTRVEDIAGYRVIPVMLPNTARISRRALPPFLRRYEGIEFHSLDDTQAFQRLVAGILGVPPIEIPGYLQAVTAQEHLPLPPSGRFERGHALIIGVAAYRQLRPLGAPVRNDATDLRQLLTDPAICGYPEANVTLLLDDAATAARIRAALADLAARTAAADTAVVFFTGHGARRTSSSEAEHYILPFDTDPADLPGTAIAGDELTALLRTITTNRLLVLFDSCHSGGTAEPREIGPTLQPGLSEGYYAALARGTGRVVIASSRPDEVSWQLPAMRNGLFTHYLLEALRGRGCTLGDGYVRVFDVFRHVAEHVPTKARQHPLFKAAAMDEDFPIALTAR